MTRIGAGVSRRLAFEALIVSVPSRMGLAPTAAPGRLFLGMNYRGSYRRLLGNSRAAIVGAIEIYNKPQFDYRDETFVILLINAWELLLKALLSKSGQSIYYKKKRGEPYRTLTWQDAFNRAVRRGAWPAKLPDVPIRKNLELLSTYRDGSVHFYNEPRFGVLLYALAQTNICNYRDLLDAGFKVKLRNDLTWQLLPLGLDPPLDPIEYLSGSGTGSGTPSTQAAREFVELLRDAAQALEEQNIDTARLMTVFQVSLQSTKKITHADIVLGVGTGGGDTERLIHRPMDPNESYPLFQKDVLEQVGDQLHGTRFTSHVFQAIVWSYALKEKKHMCWVEGHTGRPWYARDVVTFIRGLANEEVEHALSTYRDFKRAAREQRAA
jgi:uncharacterized protein DUF3644